MTQHKDSGFTPSEASKRYAETLWVIPNKPEQENKMENYERRMVDFLQANNQMLNTIVRELKILNKQLIPGYDETPDIKWLKGSEDLTNANSK